jgi:site-specific recombinase XerC
VEEIIAVMHEAGDDRHGARLRGLIVVLWRGGMRIQEALALGEGDLDPRRGSLLVRNGKGGRRREVGMDACGWELQTWTAVRVSLSLARGSASSTAPTRGTAVVKRRCPRRPAGPQRAPACAGALLRISCATPRPSRWPTKARR